MSPEYDAAQLDAEFGLTDDLEIACEYTCPACHERRELVLKDPAAHGSFPCPCGGFAFSCASFARQIDVLARTIKAYGK